MSSKKNIIRRLGELKLDMIQLEKDIEEHYKEKKCWMIAQKTENSILLHYNPDIVQYSMLSKVPDEIIFKLLEIEHDNNTY